MILPITRKLENKRRVYYCLLDDRMLGVDVPLSGYEHNKSKSRHLSVKGSSFHFCGVQLEYMKIVTRRQIERKSAGKDLKEEKPGKL